eukprot:Pompholyxophrys_punicea_v1_NODE_132_length_3289_cov_13.374652.p1 type:complete len:587 gc:universal NODE_132_length_3289_cov_13.374652:1486-3246(+)
MESSQKKDQIPIHATGLKANGIKDLREHQNFNPHTDCAIEILHAILLGLVKYITKLTAGALTTPQKTHFLALLKTEPFFGFSSALNGNPLQNWKSFHGKDFKILAQIMPYLLSACGASEKLVHGWLIVSELTKYAYKLSFNFGENCEPHPQQVEDAVSCLLGIFPSLKAKFKLHLLAKHMITDFVVFGLLVNASSERFEAINKIMRKYYLSSNFLSPSRDIAHSNSRLMASQFLILGGKWLDSVAAQSFSSAAPDVLKLAQHNAFSHLPFLRANVVSSTAALKNPRRNSYGKILETKLVDYSECNAMLRVLGMQFPIDQLRVQEFSGFRTMQESNVLCEGAAFCYHKCQYGLFLKGVKLVGYCAELEENARDIVVFKPLISKNERDLQTSSVILELKEELTFCFLSQVDFIVHVVHHCFKNGCQATSSSHSQLKRPRIEQKNASASISVVQHRGSEYLLNRFLLQKVAEEPCDWVLLDSLPPPEKPPLLHYFIRQYSQGAEMGSDESTDSEGESEYYTLDLFKKTTAELRKMCEESGLPSVGKKALLLERVARVLEDEKEEDWIPEEDLCEDECETGSEEFEADFE